MKKPPEATDALTVAELARRLNCSFEGPGDVRLTGAAGLEHAGNGDLAFLADAKGSRLLETTGASAVILNPGIAFERGAAIRSSRPQHSFIEALRLLYPPQLPEPGIHPHALVSATARIAEDVRIGPFTVIGDNVRIGKGAIVFPFVMIARDVTIGEESVLHSHVAVRENSRIGRRVIIHNGAVIGADGFGYFKEEDGSHLKIPQVGDVVIEDDVEIGALSAVDRAALDSTVIGRGSKIDNLVQVAHSVIIGENSVLASQTGIAGSSKVGRNVLMAGQVGIADHVRVGDDVIIAAKSGVPHDIPAGSFVAGIPHRDVREWRKASAAFGHLYDLVREVKRLRKRIEELERGNE